MSDTKEKAGPKLKEPKVLSISAGQRVAAEVVGLSGVETRRYILEAGHDGTLRLEDAPAPAAPVMDPDPISDPSQMEK